MPSGPPPRAWHGRNQQSSLLHRWNPDLPLAPRPCTPRDRQSVLFQWAPSTPVVAEADLLGAFAAGCSQKKTSDQVLVCPTLRITRAPDGAARAAVRTRRDGGVRRVDARVSQPALVLTPPD